MKAIQIRNWDEWFENSQSRKLRSLAWFPMPNRHDGKGYAHLSKHENATQILSGWTLLLQVASKQPRRGLLVDEDGPISVEDLALMTRFPENVFRETIEVLASLGIGWIEVIECPKSIITSGRDPVEIVVQTTKTDQKERKSHSVGSGSHSVGSGSHPVGSGSHPVGSRVPPGGTSPSSPSSSPPVPPSPLHLPFPLLSPQSSSPPSICDTKPQKKRNLQFGDPKSIPPTPEQVTAYSKHIEYPIDGEAFCDSYAQKGWVISRGSRMKDWQAAVRNWKRNQWLPGKPLPDGRSASAHDPPNNANKAAYGVITQ